MTSYAVQHIMSEPEEITTMSGQKLQLKMSVDYISFSAHTDYQQTSEFIRALKPPHVVGGAEMILSLPRSLRSFSSVVNTARRAFFDFLLFILRSWSTGSRTRWPD